jgi:two-component system LytT family response regulator
MQNLLETYCPDIEVVDTADSVNAALKAIRTHQPDIVFMDVQIQEGQDLMFSTSWMIFRRH